MLKYKSLIFFLLFVLAACAPRVADEGGLQGRILLWHSGGESEGQILDEFIQRFEETYPNVRVLRLAIAPNELRERYISATRSGLGPDLFIGDTRWLRGLADANLIRSIDEFNLDMVPYLFGAVENVLLGDSLYGIPYSLSPTALYYNTTLVNDPPETLNELLAQVESGLGLALNTSFEGGYWGVQAFGGKLFDADERVLLNQGGFASWLGWLQTTTDLPNVSSSTDDATLLRLFLDGQVAYYVGRPDNLPRIQTALDGNVAVVPLPSGPGGTSGPFLHVNAFMFNPNSPGTAPLTAVRLAQFITNSTQGATLSRRLRIVPANAQVRIDSRAFPSITGFIAQSRTAVSMPNIQQMDLLLTMGEQTYARVLDGVIAPAEAARQLTVAVNDAIGLDTLELTQNVTCAFRGELQVWHSWTGSDDMNALRQIANAYQEQCPGVTIRLTVINTPRQMVNGYTTLLESGVSPAVMLVPSNFIIDLAVAENISVVPGDERLQQFIPSTLSTVRYDGSIYGLPLTLNTYALYAHTNKMTDPPTLLENLLTEATNGNKVILPVNFEAAYWGISAFGGTTFDQNYRVVLDSPGFDQWLTWLIQAQSTPNIILVQNPTNGLDTFITGDASYIIGTPALLSSIRNTFGIENLLVAPLPDGPAGNGHPLLTTDAFVINATLTDAQTALAQDFINFATNQNSQQLILESTGYVPTNVNLVYDDYPLKSVFRAVASQSVVLPQVRQRTTLLNMGNNIYRDVLQNNVPVEDAIRAFVDNVNRVNGFEITPTVEPTPTVEITITPPATPTTEAEF